MKRSTTPARTLRLAVAIVVALQFLGGCANSDYFEPTELANTSNSMVYVYRPAAKNPGKKPLTLSYPEVLVDGESAGFLKYKEYLPVELPSGEHEFRITGLTREARWEPKDSKYNLTTEAGKSYFLRFGVEFDVDRMSLGTFRGQYIITLHPVDPDEAVYEIRHTDNGREN